MPDIDKCIKVCVFCECWESGGIESFLFNVLSNMDLTGLKVDIVVPELRQSVFTEKTKALGVDIIELSGSQRDLRHNYRLFAELLKKRRYDVLHLNAFQALSFVYGKIARKHGVKRLIAHGHNNALRKSSTRALKLVIHGAAKRAFSGAFTDFWACSRTAAEFMFPKRAAKEFTFIPNGIDIEKFAFDKQSRRRFRERLGLGGETLIVNVGRLTEQKNQSFLLDAAKALKDRNADFKLLLAGEGEKLDELKAKADRLGVADKVIFFGTTDDVPSLLCGADVFAFPSVFEGLGIVAIEAQAAALPVVCSENIPKEVFATDLAYAVDLSVGADAWANALIERAGSANDRGIEAARGIRAHGYDVRSVAQKIERSYRGIQ